MRKRGLGLLLTAAMLIGTLTGCGNSGGGDAADGGQSAPAAAADPNKIAVVAMGDYLVQDWDPAISYGVDPRVLCNVYETLLTSNPDGTYNNVLLTQML